MSKHTINEKMLKMMQMILKVVGGMLIMQLLYLSPAYAQQPEECAKQAEAASRESNDEVLDVASGAASGSLIGVMLDDSRRGAGWGFFLGGIVGSANHTSRKEEDYERAYRRCMYGLERMR